MIGDGLAMAEVVLLGRCPETRCRARDRVVGQVATDRTLPRTFRRPLMPARWAGIDASGLDRTGRVWYEGLLDVDLAQRWGLVPWCLAHRTPLRYVKLRATTTATTACDRACTTATGADCRCACGGAQHGADVR